MPSCSGRSSWFAFWLLAIALEWATLAAVVATARDPRELLRRVGLAVRLSRAELVIAASCVGAALVIAVLGAGTPQDFLARLPAGLRMFIPPAELEARLLWVLVAITAAVCEETLWRGVAITDWRGRGGSTAVAVVLSCLCFAFFHGGFGQGAVIFWKSEARGAPSLPRRRVLAPGHPGGLSPQARSGRRGARRADARCLL